MDRRAATLKRHRRWILILAVSLTCTVCVRAENWTRFRGPQGQGVSTARAIPVKWTTQDYNWKITLRGGGHSSPVVWGDRVFVTYGDGKAGRGTVLCVSVADGRELWRKDYETGKSPMNGLNSYASATPAVDAARIYLFWPGAEEAVLAALTHDGHEAWAVPLPGVKARHGAGSSPIVVGRYVIVAREQDKGSAVSGLWLAVDSETGRVAWRYEHPEDMQASYSTPCLYRDAAGRDQLLFTSNSHGVAALDAETGKLLWKTPEALPVRVVSSPVIADGVVVATCGQGGRGLRLAAVRPPGDAAPAQATEVYALDSRIVPYVPTSLARDGLLFAFHDQGTVSCLRGRTGEVLWSEKPAGRYYGSPVWVEGRLYCISMDGDVVVLQAGPTYELLAVNKLGEKSHATPAVADGRMYLRTYSNLISIGG